MGADQIIVLDDGQVAGIGTHEELLQSCEVYQEICQSQLSANEVSGKKTSARENAMGIGKEETNR